MKTRRIQGADIQAALREVRRTLGADAVIMSTRETADGIEIVAAAVPAKPAAKAPARKKVRRVAQAPADVPRTAPADPVAAPRRASRPGLASIAAGIATPLASVASSHQAAHPDVRRQLDALGLSGDVRDTLHEVLDVAGHRATPALLRNAIAARLNVEGPELMRHGGRVAVLGDTGVGKTTTIAKLAAHFARRHGPGQVALVNADQYRIGASDQLRRFGRLIGVPTYDVHDRCELEATLARLHSRKLVLVDSAGIAYRDVRFGEQLDLLGDCGLDAYLALSLNTQTAVLARSVNAFSALELRGCILTKEDEALSLGSALSMALRHALPLAYVTNGPAIPADIRLANASRLAAKAMALAADLHADETAAKEMAR